MQLFAKLLSTLASAMTRMVNGVAVVLEQGGRRRRGRVVVIVSCEGIQTGVARR